jgi:hypothetical protein
MASRLDAGRCRASGRGLDKNEPVEVEDRKRTFLCFGVRQLDSELVAAEIFEFLNCFCTKAHVLQRTEQEGGTKTGGCAAPGNFSRLLAFAL